MATLRSDWEVFIEWEVNACVDTDKYCAKHRLHKELSDQWNLRQDKQQYVAAIRALQKAIGNAEKGEEAIQRGLTASDNKGQSELDSPRELQKIAQQTLDFEQPVTAAIAKFRELQEQKDSDGKIISKDASRK